MVRNFFIFLAMRNMKRNCLCFGWPLGSRHHLKAFNGLNDKLPGDWQIKTATSGNVMSINLIYGEYFSERSPHVFLHFAVHRADCLQILRDKSQLGLRAAGSIVEENVSFANISSSAYKSPHLPKKRCRFPLIGPRCIIPQKVFSGLLFHPA